jgi:histidyl-tRNA synthetase
MELDTAKGMKDIPPEEKILQQGVMDSIRRIFERYGFAPLETPAVERWDVLSAKYAGGAEILKETFKLKDQGGRELGLRYDLTVPLARFVGMNPNLKTPFKRYQIEKVFRDGPIKLGRCREFWQCDADIVGSQKMIADAEVINLILDVFKEIGLKVMVKVNNRKLLNAILSYAGIKREKMEEAIIIIDKLEKIGAEEVGKELEKTEISKESVKKLIWALQLQTLEDMKEIIGGCDGIDELEELFSYVKGKNVFFDATLARGLSYYTGTIFEAFLKDSEITSSVAGGGRYDDLIGNFIGGKRVMPAVGTSFGLNVIMCALKGKERKTNTRVYVIPIGNVKWGLKTAEKLRELGVNADFDLSDRGVTKNLAYASSFEIPYAALVGEKEMKLKKIKIRDMKTGKERLLGIESAARAVKK